MAWMLLIWWRTKKEENTMNGFKNNMSDGWLFTQELRFFENFMNN